MFPNVDRFLSQISKILLKSTTNTHLDNKTEQNWPKIEKNVLCGPRTIITNIFKRMVFICLLYSQWTLIKSLLHWIKMWHAVWFLLYYILKVTKLYWRKLYQWLPVVMFGETVLLQRINTTESCSDGSCSVFWLWC